LSPVRMAYVTRPPGTSNSQSSVPAPDRVLPLTNEMNFSPRRSLAPAPGEAKHMMRRSRAKGNLILAIASCVWSWPSQYSSLGSVRSICPNVPQLQFRQPQRLRPDALKEASSSFTALES
jgi:hypothetical protein